jgi:hypothetical protein
MNIILVTALLTLCLLIVLGGFVSAYFDGKKDTTMICWTTGHDLKIKGEEWHCSYCSYKESLDPKSQKTR